MGQPKALLMRNGEHLIQAHIRALKPYCEHVFVIVGRHAVQIRAVLDSDVRVIENPKWAESHMSDSLRLVLMHCQGTAFVTPVDCPPAPPRVFEALRTMGAPSVPQHKEQDGHPVLIDSGSVMRQEGTLQQMLSRATRVTVDWKGAIESWNTPQEWAAYSESAPFGRS